jgi:RimJ/RimL family protein N-acetyltransferase
MLPAPTDTSLTLATEHDVSFLSALADDPAVAPFLAVGSGEEDVLRGLLSEAAADREPHGLFVIRSPEDGRMGGLALSVVNRRSRICELSRLMVRPERRRTGVASEAVRLACRSVLVDHSFHRIQLEVYGDNLAAQAFFRTRRVRARGHASSRLLAPRALARRRAVRDACGRVRFRPCLTAAPHTQGAR